MAYSTDLEKRIDSMTTDWALTKKKMFGGLAYLFDGSMCFAIGGEELLFRTEVSSAAKLALEPGVHLAVMGRRTMKNWLQAGAEATVDDAILLRLLKVGRNSSLNISKS